MNYEYHCKNCDKRFETVESMKETKSTYPCPICKNDANKVIGTPAIHGFRQGPKVMYNE